MAALSSRDIRRLIKGKPPLIEGWLDLDEQVQAKGFALTPRDCATIESGGQIAADNRDRIVSGLAPLAFDGEGYLSLEPGASMITYNEIVHLPKNIMALG